MVVDNKHILKMVSEIEEDNKDNEKKKIFQDIKKSLKILFKNVISSIIITQIYGFIIYLLWNYLFVEFFNIKYIEFIQAWLLWIGIKICHIGLNSNYTVVNKK